MPCSQLMAEGAIQERGIYSRRSSRPWPMSTPPCRCVFLGLDDRPLLLNRFCFVVGTAPFDARYMKRLRKYVRFPQPRPDQPSRFIISHIDRVSGYISPHHGNYLRHSDVMGIGAFLSLRQGIKRFRLAVLCREAVRLAWFLTCLDVMHVCLCSRGMRASVSPRAVDYQWAAMLAKNREAMRNIYILYIETHIIYIYISHIHTYIMCVAYI